jgi:hypothetical protein
LASMFNSNTMGWLGFRVYPTVQRYVQTSPDLRNFFFLKGKTFNYF